LKGHLLDLAVPGERIEHLGDEIGDDLVLGAVKVALERLPVNWFRTAVLTSMSQSMRPKASENVHTNWLMPAHRQSCRRRCTMGEGGGGGRGAATTGGTPRRGMFSVSSLRLR
jgi:hypothetical protein